MRHRIVLLAALLALTTTAALAQKPAAPSRQWIKLTIEHVKPTALKNLLTRGDWWNQTLSEIGSKRTDLPPGVDPPIAFDVDNSLLVRGTPEGLEAFRAQVALFDRPDFGTARTIRLEMRLLRLVPTAEGGWRSETVSEPVVTTRDNVSKTLSERMIADDVLARDLARRFQAEITPHAHNDGTISLLGELQLRGASGAVVGAATIRSRVQPGGKAVFAVLATATDTAKPAPTPEGLLLHTDPPLVHYLLEVTPTLIEKP